MEITPAGKATLLLIRIPERPERPFGDDNLTNIGQLHGFIMYIIKIGGGASINLEGIATDLADIRESCLIVLGANAVRDDLAEKLGSPRRTLTSISGYSSVFSDETAIDIIMMSYAGLRNKRFVELCQRRQINALGLSGIDGRLVEGVRNRGIRIREGGKNLMKRDYSGKPKKVNGKLLRLLLDNGFVPVLSIPIADENGYAINSENDDVINLLQAELQADKIIQLIEAPGFLEDGDDPESLLKNMTRADVVQREAQVEGRIKRKMLALKRLLEGAPTQVIISDGRVTQPLHEALNGAGTVIA